MSVKEKRKFARLNIPIEIIYRIIDPKDTKSERKKSLTHDISLLGIRTTLKESLPIKTIIELEMYLSENSLPLVVRGKVAWQRYSKISEEDCYITGIEFTQISFEDRERIKEAIRIWAGV